VDAEVACWHIGDCLEFIIAPEVIWTLDMVASAWYMHLGELGASQGTEKLLILLKIQDHHVLPSAQFQVCANRITTIDDNKQQSSLEIANRSYDSALWSKPLLMHLATGVQNAHHSQLLSVAGELHGLMFQDILSAYPDDNVLQSLLCKICCLVMLGVILIAAFLYNSMVQWVLVPWESGSSNVWISGTLIHYDQWFRRATRDWKIVQRDMLIWSGLARLFGVHIVEKMFLHHFVAGLLSTLCGGNCFTAGSGDFITSYGRLALEM
jgi:hypothetical protein